MECYVHVGTPAVGACVACGRFVCDVCRVTMKERIYCKTCLEKGEHEPPPPAPGGSGPGGPPAGRFYRSQNDRMIAGLCRPVGERLGIDVSLVRVLWLLLAFLTASGLGILYIIMWIVVPEEPDR